MDFIERITEEINKGAGLPIKLRTGYLGANESLVIYSLPGSTVSQVYMDESKDVNLNYEIAMNSKDGEKINKTLWLTSDFLDKLKVLASKDKNFKFNHLTITSKPFINDYNDQGWFVFLLNFTANITIFEEEQ